MAKVERKRINPKTLFASEPFGFSQVATTRGGTLVHVAGQTAWDTKMKIVGRRNLAAQAQAAFENVRRALAAAGATPADVVRMRIYVVNYKREQVGVITEAVKEFFPLGKYPASTLVGVQALAVPEFLIGVEVTAVKT